MGFFHLIYGFFWRQRQWPNVQPDAVFVLLFFYCYAQTKKSFNLFGYFCFVFAASIFTSSVKKSGSSCNSVVVKHFDNQFQFQLKQKIFVWLESSRGQRFVSRCYSTFYDSDLVRWKIFKFSDRALLFVNFQNWHNR